jgi:hypothetical protein
MLSVKPHHLFEENYGANKRNIMGALLHYSDRINPILSVAIVDGNGNPIFL